MTYLRWIHKSWSFFWNFTGVLVITIILVCGIGFGVLQLQPVKDIIANKATEAFNEQFYGVLSIGELDGLLPFQISVTNVKLYADSSRYNPVLQADKIETQLNIRSFLTNRFEVDGLNIQKPKVIVDQKSNQSIQHAFQMRVPDSSDSRAFFELLAPVVNIEEGNLVIRNIDEENEKLASSDSLTFQHINLDMFFELSSDQRFMDIDRLNFDSPELQVYDAEVYGQVYNDSQFLEFNAFNANIGQSRIRFNGEANGVNLITGNLLEQVRAAKLEMNVEELILQPDYVSQVFPDLPKIEHSVYASLAGKGTLDSLWFDKLELSMGESAMISYGYITNLNKQNELGYGLTLENLQIAQEDLAMFSDQLSEAQKQAIAEANVEGYISGDLNYLEGDIALSGERGRLGLEGEVRFIDRKGFDLTLESDSLDIGNLLEVGIPSSSISLNGKVSVDGFNVNTGSGKLAIQAGSGSIADRKFEAFTLTADWERGYINPEFTLKVDGSTLDGKGYIDLQKSEKIFSIQGSAEKLTINELLNIEGLRHSVVDLEYDVSLTGNALDELYGQISLDIPRAYVGEDTLSRHQFYLDFNAPDAPVRSLRLTSTGLDATIEGDYNPSELLALAKHWNNYFTERINKEILFNDSLQVVKNDLDIKDQSLTLTGKFKNPSLLKAYYPAFPSVETAAKISSSISISPDRLLFNGSVSDQKFIYNEFTVDSVRAQITGSFRYENTLKEFSGLQIQATAGKFERNIIEAKGFEFYAELDQDSIFITNNIRQLADNAFFNMQSSGILSDSTIAFTIQNFDLGTDNFAWNNQGTPSFSFSTDQRLTLKDFSFTSGGQQVQIEGTYSRFLSDSVNYRIDGVELSRISSMINGRIDFGGEMNGIFTTRTLTTVPTIQGDIDIERFNLDGSTVGDVRLRSAYNQPANRFDTSIEVTTDSTKYPAYFASNQRRGQDLKIDGYIMGPEDGEFSDADSLYAFDIDLENIDMWILPYIGPKVFAEASGLSSGKGKLWGNLDDFDFRIDFMVGLEDAVYFQPLFLDTYYYAQGPITFTRERGLEFEDVFLIDPTGGNALLSGYFDFNDFQPINYMDIRVEMDDFQFLNSDFDPSLPFYGKAFGSSTITIKGTNIDPVLTTETPLIISDFSRISIPLLEETEFNEDNKFIRFVSSFDLKRDSLQLSENERNVNFAGVQETDPGDLTFAERFTLDLQIEANNPMTVELIFDPVTGEVVTANGTGRLRIRLEDQEVSMFGRFDITEGSYQFVSGDIFKRRFDLASGGSILWEGDPANARINLNAVYHARPDIRTLAASTTNSQTDATSSQRIPVELVLNISGTISSIENNFFFRLPNTFESRQYTTESTQLAALNRNEDEKLIQATSLLLMGDFIPVAPTGAGQTNTFGENLSGSAAVLNPLLSNQVISPLLSNQINSLLNSDLSRFDVDFNLNTYNEIDLGVALRLYNDKLILRREGQITGRQSNIGDLGATYRINRTFSVTAFHRQDPTFGTISSTDQSPQSQSQDINGVGVEAKFSFNRWKEFFKKISSPFRKLFGIDNKEEEITENREGGQPS